MLPWSGKNIYFIGFMASGKSSIGKSFAKFLGWPFHDTDDLVEKRAGRSISEIFAQDGEEAFRQLETAVLKELAEQKNCVVALGGGAVMRDENWRYLRNSGVTISLTAPVEVLADRIGRNDARPLMAQLSHAERVRKIQEMLARRQPYYDRADFHFESSAERSASEFVHHIYATLLEKL
ncbi:shikimate kinase [candidate division KSB1 bacterium]|nr:shikimate kinase [candidate division KSB1 bacterium]RQW03812.1 MAG: shikimate kinase [candidate division KSB1 bacterium]